MTAPIRVLVVDDELPARQTIEDLLKDHAEFELCASCPDGESALEAIMKHGPDLVFLDIQMPGMNGFDLLKECVAHEAVRKLPFVVFVTAYDRFALRAFEYHALDFLLKPFSDDRFERALDHAREQVFTSKAGEFGKKLKALLEEYSARGTSDRLKDPRFAVKEGGKVVFINFASIAWFEAGDHYILVHTMEKAHIYRGNLNRLESQLDPNRFLRIHRSAIVNADHIRELRCVGREEYEVRLSTGESVPVSRRRSRKIRELLGIY